MSSSEITQRLGEPLAPGPGRLRPSPLMKRADAYLLAGIALAGTWAFGLLAIPFLVVAGVLLNRAQRRGELTRPWSVTIIGSFCLIDASINTLGWGLDLFWAHDTGIVQTLWSGYGRLADGGYYIDYNGLSVGGLGSYGEKTMEIWGVLVLYPMRLAAAWGFLQMKRWGLQAMVITSYMYIAFIVGYVGQFYLDFDARAGAAEWGVLFAWFMFLPYISAFVVLPYLYTVNREMFADTR